MVVGFSPTTYGMRNDPAATSPVIMRKLEVEGKKKPKETVIGIKETISFQKKKKNLNQSYSGLFFRFIVAYFRKMFVTHLFQIANSKIAK